MIREKILSATLYLKDNVVLTRIYKPPLDYTTFREAFDDGFFIYRTDYPSYKQLGFVPISSIKCIQVVFVGRDFG